MKRIIALFLASLFISLATAKTAYASAKSTSPNCKYIYEDVFIITSIITIDETKEKSTGLTHSKSADKTFTIKTSNGSLLAEFTLHGTFHYDGAHAVCANASYSSSLFHQEWKYTYQNAWKNNNQATGAFTLRCDSLSKTLSETLTLTCSANGTIF